jgi:hypothetical protein
MLETFHEEGHGGEKQMIAKITDAGFWWERMREDITRQIGACKECLRINVIQEGFHSLQPIITTYPMQHTQADLICGVPKSAEGHSYILVYICLATRFTWLFALKDKKSETVADCIISIHLPFGNVKVLQTDNGKEFKNRILQNVAKINEFEFRTISSYHSQGNGSVERRNRDVSTILKKVCSNDFFRWHQLLGLVSYYVNIAVSSRTKTSPFILMFGRRPVGNQDYVLSTLKLPPDMKVWLENWKRMEEVIYPAIAERVSIEQAKAALLFERDHRIIDEIAPGSLVMIKDVTRQSKWTEYYSGPFEVIRRNEGGAYLLKDGLGHQLPFRIPVNHIKLAPHAKQSVEGHYVVKKILSHRLIDDKTEYLVRWEKESIMDSWVLAEHFDGGSMVDDYIRKHKVYIDQSHAESSIGQSAQDTIAAADQSHAESGIYYSLSIGIGQSAQDTIAAADQSHAESGIDQSAEGLVIYQNVVEIVEADATDSMRVTDARPIVRSGRY